MVTITQVELAWELRQAELRVPLIAERVGKHRATVYRWLQGIRRAGLRDFVRAYQNAKKGKRRRKAEGYVARRILSLRREHHDCCGEKIVWWLGREGIRLSRSTVYRVLHRYLTLRPAGRRNRLRGPVPRAQAPRQVIQMDTLDLGQLYAYTAIDTYTREAQVVLRPGLSGEDGREALERVMAYFGRCEVLQTDGGHEFGGQFEAAAGHYAGRHRMARPYRRNEQAFVESFNRTLRKECVGWLKYKRQQLAQLQKEVERYLDYYHYQRPHLSLNLTPPLPRPLSHLS